LDQLQWLQPMLASVIIAATIGIAGSCV